MDAPELLLVGPLEAELDTVLTECAKTFQMTKDAFAACCVRDRLKTILAHARAVVATDRGGRHA